jgi:DNA-binding LytR/AlgR family response regulator
VDYFAAADKYTIVHAAGREWPIRLSLRGLEQQLDPESFWRVHRGTLVRVGAIRAVRRDIMGRLRLELHAGGPPLAVSRGFAHLFRQT